MKIKAQIWLMLCSLVGTIAALILTIEGDAGFGVCLQFLVFQVGIVGAIQLDTK
jgi:hypothetical protein